MANSRFVERILTGDVPMGDEVRRSNDPDVVAVVRLIDDEGFTSPDSLSGVRKIIYKTLKEAGMHGALCPCWSCKSQMDDHPM